jgi:uncharacterized protein (UPF0335 family)
MTDTHGAAKIAEPFVAEIEHIYDDLESLKGEYMARCKARRAEIKDIYSEAKDKGVPKRPLKGIVKARALQRKIDNIDSDFEIDEAATKRALAASAAQVKKGAKAENDPGGDINL